MGYPRKLLSEHEHIEFDLHPHAKALILPVLVLFVVAFGASWAIWAMPEGSRQAAGRWVIAALAAAVLVIWVVRPFLRWVTTHYVITDHRVIVRHGIIARTGRDMLLTRINDIGFSHTAIERLLGCGSLVVESAGERGQLTLSDVPRVEYVQRRLNELASAEMREATS
ncbi:MAG: PH domain-containing protein [Angustibacter sp.]